MSQDVFHAMKFDYQELRKENKNLRRAVRLALNTFEPLVESYGHVISRADDEMITETVVALKSAVRGG